MEQESIKHRYFRLWDGRIIDMADEGFLEYRDANWVTPGMPITMDMVWFAEMLDSIEDVLADEYGNDLLLIRNCLMKRSFEDIRPRTDSKVADSIVDHLRSVTETGDDARVFVSTATVTEVPDLSNGRLEAGQRIIVVSYNEADDYRYMLWPSYNEEGKIVRTTCLCDGRYRFIVHPSPKDIE